VYQSPIAGQCRDVRRFDRVFSGHTTRVTDERPLLVFFWSERSGPARRMESLLAHLERKERERLRVRRVDVDAQPEIAARFRVEVVPTLVLVKDRRAVSRLVGRTSAPKIEAMLEPHLAELAAA
jgi:thioredoxin-like negative regulator of GroEL